MYYPYDFRFIFDQPRWVLGYNKDLRRTPLEGSALYKELADWQNAWLKRQYEVFAVRDPAYLERMEKELKSENGFVNLIYEDDWFIGMESEWGLKERELRLVVRFKSASSGICIQGSATGPWRVQSRPSWPGSYVCRNL